MAAARTTTAENFDDKSLTLRSDPGVPGIPEELLGYTGLEGIDVSTFIIPRIKLVQPTTKEADATPGKLRINLTGDEFSSLPVIVVKAIQDRTLWSPDPKSETVLCRSYDFLKPDSSVEKPCSAACAKKITNLRKQEVLTVLCDQARWHGDKKPECSENFNLLCLQAEDLLPFWITMHGTSILPVRKYLSAIALRQSRLFQWQTDLSSEMKTEPAKHYVAKFSAPKPVTSEQSQQVMQTILELGLMDIDIRRTIEAEDTMMGGPASVAAEEGDNAPPPAPDWVQARKE